MSRKRKRQQPTTTALPAALLQSRIDKALREGRTQQALELARTLFKQEPTPAHRELVRKVSLERSRQLRAKGYTRDAAVLLDNAAQLGGEPAFLEQVAQELAACGNVERALKLLEGAPSSPALGRIMGHAADAALRQGKAGRDNLHEPLRPQLDLVLQAFAQAAAGQDEEARATLQGIGLQSPFLEWKVLLRGLMAYYQNDDTRALENWQRLDAERLPARLAAPLRFAVDGSFRTAQPPATQAALQEQMDALQGSSMVPSLRAVQRSLANEHHLPQAFRQAETLLPKLRQEAPQLIPRLAYCFWWSVISHGQPEDVGRYRRVFGAPADDPHLARLEALSLDHRHLLPEAHKVWEKFEKSVASHPEAWPGGQAARVRALVWRHMAENADSVPDLRGLPELPPFLRDHPARPRPLKPSAEECLEQSIELAPDQLETYVALFEHYREKEEDAKAEKAARRLLERFPDHAATLEGLGNLLLARAAYAEALDVFQRALKANPLERRLRGRVSTAYSYKARQDAEAGRFEEARAGYQAALSFDDSSRNYPVLCKWAACEFKAGNAERAEELLTRAHAEENNRLAVAFSMLIETIRFKLPKPLKDRFDREVKELLAQPPSGAAAAAIADTAASLRAAGVTYYGQKTHEKKVTTYLEKAAKTATFTEEQLALILDALRALKVARLHATIAALGQRTFPESPFFYLAEAEYAMMHSPHRDLFRARMQLETAQRLANKLPRDDRQHKLLERIQHLLDAVNAMNPFANLFGGGGGFPFEMFDPFGDEEDFEDGDDW